MNSLPIRVAVRAHSKAHKSGHVAQIQTALDGCIGVCAQKLCEAEAMVEADIEDILISNQIAVSPFKTARLTALLKRAISRGKTKKMSVCVDAAEQIRELGIASANSEFPGGVGAMIELDVGHNRCGVDTAEQCLELCSAIEDTHGVYFAGLQAYHGLIQHVRDSGERARMSKEICEKVISVKKFLSQNGFVVPLVTGAGTGSFLLEGASGVYDEVQPGSYIWMDVDYGRNPDTKMLFQPSLFIASTVMSTAAGGSAKVVLDAGMKAIDFVSGPPRLAAIARGNSVQWLTDEEADTYMCENGGDEHCILTHTRNTTAATSSSSPTASSLSLLQLGDTVLLIPGHCDPQVGLYDFFSVLCPAASIQTEREGEGGAEGLLELEAVWKISRSVGF